MICTLGPQPGELRIEDCPPIREACSRIPAKPQWPSTHSLSGPVSGTYRQELHDRPIQQIVDISMTGRVKGLQGRLIIR